MNICINSDNYKSYNLLSATDVDVIELCCLTFRDCKKIQLAYQRLVARWNGDQQVSNQ